MTGRKFLTKRSPNVEALIVLEFIWLFVGVIFPGYALCVSTCYWKCVTWKCLQSYTPEATGSGWVCCRIKAGNHRQACVVLTLRNWLT